MDKLRDHSPDDIGIREPVVAGDGTVLVDYHGQTSRERLCKILSICEGE